MGKPAAPTPSDPRVVAQAQTASNQQTAETQASLNNTDTRGPTGSVTYSQTAPDRWLQTTALSPAEQQTYDLSKQAENASLGIANQQTARVGNALGQTLDTSGLPALTGAGSGPTLNNSITAYQNQGSFNPGQSVQGQINTPDQATALQQAQNAVYSQATSRLDPQYAQMQEQLDTKLANQGLGGNSTAAINAQDTFNRGRNDAYNQANYSAIGAGNQLQNQLFDQSATQGQFANQAAGQQYAQNQGAVDFANQAGNQTLQNQTSAQGFNNAANQQLYSNQLAGAQVNNAARGQGLQEQAYVQNQPINQLSALLGLGQVSQPQGAQGNTPVAPTNVVGAYGNYDAANQANYQAQNTAYSGLLGGLAKLGSAAISDSRLKRDIRRLGTWQGLGLYAFRYLWSDVEHIGVMAQEVLKVKPWAVVKIGPWLAVDYGAL